MSLNQCPECQGPLAPPTRAYPALHCEACNKEWFEVDIPEKEGET